MTTRSVILPSLGLLPGGSVTYVNALHCQSANSETLRITSDDPADLRFGDADVSWAGWVRPTTLPGTNMAVWSKYQNAGGLREWTIFINSSDQMAISGYNATAGIVTAADTTFGALSTGTWYFVVAYHDASANVLGITVNAGTPVTGAFSGGFETSYSGDFHIGSEEGAASFFNGRVQSLGIWTRVISGAERTELYASGAGLLYADLSAGLLTGLEAWWDLGEESAGTGAISRLDSTDNDYDLTDINTCPSAEGVTPA